VTCIGTARNSVSGTPRPVDSQTTLTSINSDGHPSAQGSSVLVFVALLSLVVDGAHAPDSAKFLSATIRFVDYAKAINPPDLPAAVASQIPCASMQEVVSVVTIGGVVVAGLPATQVGPVYDFIGSCSNSRAPQVGGVAYVPWLVHCFEGGAEHIARVS